MLVLVAREEGLDHNGPREAERHQPGDGLLVISSQLRDHTDATATIFRCVDLLTAVNRIVPMSREQYEVDLGRLGRRLVGAEQLLASDSLGQEDVGSVRVVQRPCCSGTRRGAAGSRDMLGFSPEPWKTPRCLGP